MKKYVKGLLADQFASRLEGVEDALLVDVMELDANTSVSLRRHLHDKDINLMVIRNRLARRATEGTPLAPALEGMEGSLAFCWGAEDFVSLAKEIAKLDADEEEFVDFHTRGGVMDGEQLSPERVKEISKWPSRAEQLSMLLGQILGPGAEVVGAVVGPGGTLAGQIKQKSEGDE